MTLPEILGLALAILGLAFAFETPRHWFLRLVRLHRKRQEDERTYLSGGTPVLVQARALHTSATNPFSSPAQSLSVRQMVEAVRASPLLQQEEVSRNFSGIHVDWTGYLRSAELDFRDSSRVRVNLIVNRDEVIDYSFWFSVELAQVPELKILRRNSKLRAVGKVIKVALAGLSVEIEATNVEILERVVD